VGLERAVGCLFGENPGNYTVRRKTALRIAHGTHFEFASGKIISGMVPSLPISGVQSHRYSISAPWLIFVNHLGSDGPIPAFNTEETIKGYIRDIQQMPRFS
jgi:hypothetical protein